MRRYALLTLLLLATSLGGAPAESLSCYGSDIVKGAGVPYGAQDDGHSAAHADAIFEGQSVVGWIYRDKDDSTWLGTAHRATATEEQAKSLALLADSVSTFAYTPQSFFGIHMPLSVPGYKRLVDDQNYRIVKCY
jgi:hypothetical protein